MPDMTMYLMYLFEMRDAVFLEIWGWMPHKSGEGHVVGSTRRERMQTELKNRKSPCDYVNTT
jgi:hypothetical protein